MAQGIWKVIAITSTTLCGRAGHTLNFRGQPGHGIVQCLLAWHAYCSACTWPVFWHFLVEELGKAPSV